jgi:hypothetical protein
MRSSRRRRTLTQSAPELAVKEILERTVVSPSEVEAAHRETLQEQPHDIDRARKLFADANERWFAECARLG